MRQPEEKLAEFRVPYRTARQVVVHLDHPVQGPGRADLAAPGLARGGRPSPGGTGAQGNQDTRRVADLPETTLVLSGYHRSLDKRNLDRSREGFRRREILPPYQVDSREERRRPLSSGLQGQKIASTPAQAKGR
jgi:hypothetical protein